MITRYNPFAAFENLPETRAFTDTLSRWLDESTTGGRPWTPAVDVFETENELVLKADVPEVDMKDVNIEVENHTLTIKGQRKFENEKKQKGYHRIERSYGSFARYFTLPDTVDTEKVTADYKNGVLSVTLPKKEVAKPKSVKIELKN